MSCLRCMRHMIHNRRSIVNILLKGQGWMIVPLTEATADTCGGKAGALGALLRAGLPVPDGFVLPFAAYLAATRDPDPARPAGEPDDPGTARRTIEARPLHATVIG